ncbi:unnamed protein product [Sympodiomycopsis kandeliae]
MEQRSHDTAAGSSYRRDQAPAARSSGSSSESSSSSRQSQSRIPPSANTRNTRTLTRHADGSGRNSCQPELLVQTSPFTTLLNRESPFTSCIHETPHFHPLYSQSSLSIRAASIFESTSKPSSSTQAAFNSSNDAARAKAIDLQHTSAETEGAEGVTHSLRSASAADKGEDEFAKAQQLSKDAAAIEAQAEEGAQEEEESATSSAYLISYFIAGGTAGAASRTVVSPLERLKIIMQVQPRTKGSGNSKAAYGGVVSGLMKMWKEEGFAGFMRGNGINCLRIVPYSAIQFCTYEIAKEKLKDKDGQLDTPRRLLAGAIGGTFSCVGTFPLDLVRARISIASASLYADAKAVAADAETTSSQGGDKGASKPAAEAPKKLSRQELRQLIADKQKGIPGIWAMTAKVYREEGGIRGLYRGCVPTSAGVAPYVAINFAAYEALRKRFIDSETGQVSTLMKLSCGALAGSISQTITYPLDVLRRRMQVAGMKNSKLGYSDKNAIDAIRNILKRDGVLGLYRGLWPNLLKVAPSIGTSFLVYETVQSYIHPHPPPVHGNGAKSHH